MFDPLVSLAAALLIAGVMSALFWPGRGLIPRLQQGRRLSRRVLSEDALKHLYKREMSGRTPSIAGIAGTLHISLNETAQLVADMEADGLVRTEQGEIQLTSTGREAALHIIRAHRLWERYLAEETGIEEQAWHAYAEQIEHSMTPADADVLAAQLGNPIYDPHGDPIPTARGEIRGHGGQPLPKMPVAAVGRIVHLEDEPDIVYAQLLAEGLYLGQIVRIIESTPGRVRFWTNGDEHVLAPMVAANISVVPLEQPERFMVGMPESLRLSRLEPGETAEVVAISPLSRGAERRRLLDLGILPGTRITAEFNSPSGDPVAYRIRGAVIALRENQAQLIRVRRVEHEVEA